MKKQASPSTVVVAIVIVALIIGGLWYKFLGPGSQPPAAPETAPNPAEQAGEPKLDPKAPGGEGVASGVAGEPVLR